jgi:stage II sporulation protein D
VLGSGLSLVTVGLLRLQAPHVLALDAPGYQARAAGHALSLSGPTQLVARGTQVELRRGPKLLLRGPQVLVSSRSPFLLGTRRYEGELKVGAKGALLPDLTLPLETYVAATTGDEMPADWPAAALGAQALASRSYAVAMRGRHHGEGYDFCDLTHCQLFRGLAAADPRVAAAAAASAGKVLGWHGRAIAALWHSTCGGRLAPNDQVFGGEPLPYLRGGPDRDARGRPWCADSPHAHPWHAAYGPMELQAALRKANVLGPAEPLGGFKVRDTSDVTLAIQVDGSRPRTLTGYELWMALGPSFGWGEIKSPRFTIASEGTRWGFRGEGLGHLVGMCQWGARGRALAGQPAEAILGAYFPGAAVMAAGTRRPAPPAGRPATGP